MKDNPLKIIANAQQFEELCCALAQFKYGDFDAQKFGRSGQKQWGVDIQATYKKSKDQKIVIQCKFKEKPEESKIEEIKKEIQNELAQAIRGHSFEYFVYASNIPRDTNLQNFAKSLCTKEYEVIFWSQQDIEEDIYRYERLKQFYTLNGTKHGVDIINTDFVDTLREKEQSAKPNIFRYYTSSEINNTKWYGIINDWDVIRNAHFDFLKSINESFSNEFIESKVGGIILGEGGSGKSVFLRRIAIEICIKQKDIVVWWVTDLQSFYSRDINTIDDNSHYKHLLIIEDWYRTVGNDYSYSGPIFNWLMQKNNVRVIIGDRTINSGYRTHITNRNKFLISLDENLMILETIKDKIPNLKDNIVKLLDNNSLISLSPIFIILYVLSELSENEIETVYDEMNFENMFKELIGKKIATLEEDIRYNGIGKGLYISAVIFSDKSSNFFSISENAFLNICEFLGKNNEITQRVKSNGKYPEEFNSLVSFKDLNFKSGFVLSRLSFNHDLLAEKGISLIQDTKYKLNFNFDRYEVEKLITLCLYQSEYNVALTLFLWLNNNFRDISITTFVQCFWENLDKLNGGGLSNYLRSLNFEQKINLTKEILIRKDFLKLPSQIVSYSLRVWHNEKSGKDKAKEILEQKDFFELPSEIVSHSLWIWQNDRLGKDKAKQILEQKDYFKLPPQIVSHSLRIWQNDLLGKDKAKEILEQKDFFKLPSQIVSNSLRIWQNDLLGKDKAKEILEQKDFFKLPSQIVSNSLRIWQNDLLGKDKAKEILEQKNFFKLPFEIVSHSLRIWQNDLLGKDKAKEILDHDEFLKLSKEIVSHSLRIWQNDKLGKDKAKEILEQKNFFNLPHQIVSHSLRIWQNDELGKNKAKEILDQKDFFKLPFEIVSHSLRIWQNDKLGKDKAKEILDLFINNKDVHTFLIFNSIRVFCIQVSKEKIIEVVYNKINSLRKEKKYGRLYFDLLYLPLFHIEQHYERVLDTIENYSYNCGMSQKRNLISILNCFKEYPIQQEYYYNLKKLTSIINLNWWKDLEYQKKNKPTEIYDAHIALSISYIHSKSESKMLAKSIIEYCEGNTLLSQQQLFKTATEILSNEEFVFWE